MKTDSEFALSLIGRALKNGATGAEVFQKVSRKLSVEVKSGEVEAVETSLTSGYGLRVIKDGRLGFSYSTDIAESEYVVDTALEISGYADRDEFLNLPGPSEPNNVAVFDPSVSSITETDAIDMALLVEQSAFAADGKIQKTRNAEVSFYEGETLIVNSKGVLQSYRSTFCSAHIMAVAEDGSEAQMGWDYQGGRFLNDVSFKDVGTVAAKRALSMLGARKTNPVRGHVLLENLVAAEFLSVFSSMLSSEAVQKGKSLLKGRLGEKVISDKLDIIDDGLLEHGPGTRAVDDEGVPVRRNILIKNGALQGLMYNSYTAKKEGVISTGNAVRGGYSSIPSVGPSNLFITSENKLSFDHMLGSIDKGLLVTEAMGMHTANPVSGEFSVGVSGLWIEGGKALFPVKEAVISGNLLDFFGKVEAVGDDIRFYGSIGSPGLLFSETDISA